MTIVIKNIIPNTVSCLNLFSGCIACIMAFEAQYEMALFFIILSAIFDFFDGEGLTESNKSKSSVHGMEQTIDIAKREFEGLCFVNLVFQNVFGGIVGCRFQILIIIFYSIII